MGLSLVQYRFEGVRVQKLDWTLPPGLPELNKPRLAQEKYSGSEHNENLIMLQIHPHIKPLALR